MRDRLQISLPFVVSLGALLGIVVAMVTGCGEPGPERRIVHVVGAASMRGVLDELATRYEQSHPGARVRVQTGGSTALSRMVLELDLRADLVVLADAELFEDLLEPQWTSFHVRLASDRVVLAYTDDSVGAEFVDGSNWQDVVLRDDVEVAIADPDQAPVGYRTLLALRLAGRLRPGADLERRVWNKARARNLRPDVAELLAPLEAGAVDFAFLYRATARAAGLRYVELGPDVDLGDPSRFAGYARVEIRIRGRTPGETIVKRGAPIVYGASIPAEGYRPDSIELLAELLSDEGRALLERHGFTPVPADMVLTGRLPPQVAERLGAAGIAPKPQ